MNIQDEKRLLLQGIRQIIKEVEESEYNLEIVKRYHNLVNCLVGLNWRECGLREGEGSHQPSNTNEVS